MKRLKKLKNWESISGAMNKLKRCACIQTFEKISKFIEIIHSK